MRIEHVLQAEVAAAVQVSPAEVLHQLEVVQTVSQRHDLLQADICSAGGGGERVTGRRGKDKAMFAENISYTAKTGLKKNKKNGME